MDDKDFEIFIKNRNIKKKAKLLAKQIDEKYDNEEVVLVCVLKGAIMFYDLLLRYIKNKNVEIDFIEVKSYCGTTSTGKVKMLKDVSVEIKNKHLVLVEDIIDTGITADYLYKYYLQKNPKSILMCSLLQKPEKLMIDLKMETMIGFNIENKFVIGFGLDLDEKYRTLKDVLVLKENK